MTRNTETQSMRKERVGPMGDADIPVLTKKGSSFINAALITSVIVELSPLQGFIIGLTRNGWLCSVGVKVICADIILILLTQGIRCYLKVAMPIPFFRILLTVFLLSVGIFWFLLQFVAQA